MTSKQKNGSNKMSRGKFFRFLGGIGLLSLIPGIPASAQERKFESPRLTGRRITDSPKILRSPTIKGKLLSNDVLTASLSTKNLENIRDLMTGRFFGRVAENAFRDGYVPLITWGLGQKGSETGCFVQAKLGPGDLEPETMSNCTMLVIAREDDKMVFLDIYHTSAMAQGPLDLDSGTAPMSCGAECASKCWGVYCSGTYCNPKNTLDLFEMLGYPTDQFVSEITKILKTTDIGIIQNELKAVIFSDEVLNMGLQHFVEAAHQTMIDEVDGV